MRRTYEEAVDTEKSKSKGKIHYNQISKCKWYLCDFATHHIIYNVMYDIFRAILRPSDLSLKVKRNKFNWKLYPLLLTLKSWAKSGRF